MAQKIDARSKYWNNGYRIGINKSCVFINRMPWDKPLKEMDIPWDLLENETVGFQGITDCMWNIFEEDVIWLLKNFRRFKIKMLVFCTKMNISDNIIKVITNNHLEKHVVFNISLTGLDFLENTSTDFRLNVIKKCMSHNLNVLPIIHPYIHGVSDISFMDKLHDIGIKYISWKGFRYNEKNMHLEGLIDHNILHKYVSENEEEIMIGEQYLREIADRNKLIYTDIKKYISEIGKEVSNPIAENTAISQLNRLSKRCVLSSSSDFQSVIDYRVKHRCI